MSSRSHRAIMRDSSRRRATILCLLAVVGNLSGLTILVSPRIDSAASHGARLFGSQNSRKCDVAGPLAGYRVLDLSRILAGPWLAQLLSDLGAEVWKIERPGTGDDTRQWGPPFLRKDDGIDTTESAYFLSANRGKHSICVDISTDEGSAIVRALGQQADLVIENYKVGDMARYGLDYESLKRV